MEKRILRGLSAAATLALVILLVATAESEGQTFTYVTQKRSVSEALGGPTISTIGGGLSAPDFGPFNVTSSVSGDDGSASQSMDALLNPFSISDSGSFSGHQPADAGAGYAEGYAAFDVVFNVTQEYVGLLSASDGGWDVENDFTGGTLTLTGPGASVSWSFWNGNPYVYGLSDSQGVDLTPGQYELVANLYDVHEGEFNYPVGLNYDVELAEAPEPGTGLALFFISAGLLRRRRRGRH